MRTKSRTELQVSQPENRQKVVTVPALKRPGQREPPEGLAKLASVPQAAGMPQAHSGRGGRLSGGRSAWGCRATAGRSDFWFLVLRHQK